MADWRARLPTGRREFRRWVSKLNGHLWELEHFVVRPLGPKTKPTGNVAIVVFKDGRAFVGRSKCSATDQWNHKRGFNIAVGRALKRAWSGVLEYKPQGVGTFTIPIGTHAFTVPMNGDGPIGGVELRDYCRGECGL